MTLRYFPADGEPLLPKIPGVCVPSVASSVVFGSAVHVLINGRTGSAWGTFPPGFLHASPWYATEHYS
jgi:hypothetical protein